MVEAFKINVRAAIMANPTRPVAQNYEEKMVEFKSGLDIVEREEFLSVCPTLRSMERCLYR